MATIERIVKRVKKSNKTKIEFQIPEEEQQYIDNTNVVSNEENTPLINANEFNPNESVEGRAQSSNSEIMPNSCPSAPPEEEHQPIGLENVNIRRKFIQKVYAVLMAQQSFTCGLIALFVYIPHLRKIFRKWVFDPLFLSSVIGIPLCISVVLLIISPAIRKRFAFTTMVLITASLSLLISYAISPKTADAFLYSMGSCDLCSLGVIMASNLVDFTKWRYICFIPISMIGSSALAPTILKTSLNNTIWPSIMMTGLMTYLGANTRPVIKYNDLNIEPHEYLFAATQLYLNPEQSLKHRLRNWCCGRQRDRTSYTAI